VFLLEYVALLPKALVMKLPPLFNDSALVIFVSVPFSWLTILYKLFESVPNFIYSPLYLLERRVPERLVSLSPFRRYGLSIVPSPSTIRTLDFRFIDGRTPFASSES